MMKMGDVNGAQPHAEKAHDLAPKNPSVADTLGVIVLARGDSARALQLLQEAANGAPDRADIQYHLAKARAKNGDTEEARKILRQILGSNNSFPERDDAKSLLQQLGG